MTREEDAIQLACIEVLRRFVPAPEAGGPAWTAVNPIPSKTRVVAARSKALGMRAGWPDIQLVWRGQFYGVEIKTQRGRLSPAQRQIHREIGQAGGVCVVVRSVDDFIGVLRACRIPCAARTREAA